MQQHLIYWPVLAQIAIPLAVLILNGRRKAADVAAGNHRPDESATDNTAWSLPVVLTSNNLANQSQLPVLFYVLCIVLAQIGAVSALTLSIAWLFVASRILHAYVHVSSNYVPLRKRAFIFGALTLLLLFILCAIALLQT